MLNRLPKNTPSFAEMLRDIGSPSDKATAKALGVTIRTVKTWKKTQAPRPILLSLFWLTRWGMSETNAEVRDLSDMHYNVTVTQRLEIKRLQGTIEQLQKIGHFGCANDPLNNHPAPIQAYGLPERSPSPGLYKTRPEFSLTQTVIVAQG